MIVMVMVMRRRKEEMRDPVSQRIHHEFCRSSERGREFSIHLVTSGNQIEKWWMVDGKGPGDGGKHGFIKSGVSVVRIFMNQFPI